MQANEIAMMLETVARMRGEWADAFRLILKYLPASIDPVRAERVRYVFGALRRIHKV